MIVNVIVYTLFVTSRCDVILILALVWRSLLTQRANYSARTLLTRYCSLPYVTVIHMNKLALHIRRPEQNTVLNAKTEQFMTATISGKR